MAECFKCGVSDEREKLFDAVSGKGVVKICRNCAREENLPLVQPVELNKPEKTRSVYERLSDMAKIDPEKHRSMLLEKAKQDSMGKYNYNRERRKETTLKNVIDSNYQKNKPQPRTDLVPNFHWVIMRARRAKKLTQKQLAENIGEPETSIVNAENGVILNNSDTLIRKLENYFNIKILNTENAYTSSSNNLLMAGSKEARERFEKEGKFDRETSENLTISDLQEIDKKSDSGSKKGLFSFFRRKKEKSQEEKSEEDKQEISDEEADKILFSK